MADEGKSEGQETEDAYLARLKAKRKAYDDRIRKIEGAREQKKRKAENNRKFLAGTAVLSEAERDADFKKWLYALLDRFLSKARDRAAFGLPPRTASTTPAGPVNEQAPEEHTPEMEDA